VSDEVRDVDNRERGTVERKRFVELRYCAALPAITPKTKFLAITLHDPDRPTPEYEGLYDVSKEADARANENNRRTWLAGDALYLISIGAP
jgi:hypothetical protein